MLMRGTKLGKPVRVRGQEDLASAKGHGMLLTHDMLRRGKEGASIGGSTRIQRERTFYNCLVADWTTVK